MTPKEALQIAMAALDKAGMLADEDDYQKLEEASEVIGAMLEAA